MRTGLNVNIAANLLARGWNALMSFIFVPVYLSFIGAEGYGFISLFAAIAGLFALLDFGLSMTANREIARHGARAEDRSKARAMLRTFEVVYWVIALLIGGAIALMADFVVHSWITLHTIPLDQAKRGVQLMGLLALVRWPTSLYLGALQGMQRQVQSNAITTVSATLAGGGAVLILWLVAPRVDLFVAWQVLVFAVQISVLRIAAWRGLALNGDRPRARLAVLRQSAGFSLGVTGITLLSLALTQLDKLVLTKLLSLKDYGYYAVASGIATLLMTLGSAVETATFPALTTAIEQGDADGEEAIYQKASRMLAVLVVPIALTIALFAPQLLQVYLGDAEAVSRISPILTLLALGNLCLALVFLPLALQLAHGWTSLSIYKNIVAVLIYVPLLLYLVPLLGAKGAALCWLLLTLGYFLIEVPVMHRRLLKGTQWRWYLSDLGKPFGIALAVLGLTWLALPDAFSPWQQFALIALAGFLAQAGCLLLIPDVLRRLRGISILGRYRQTNSSSKDSEQ